MNNIKRERNGGIALLAAAAFAVVIANSAASETYLVITRIEALKAAAIFLFFLSIGIELRQEVTHGILSKPRKAIVPVLAAVGGMALPALIFISLNQGLETSRAWGVPISFDIAFALGALAIAGSWLPRQVRVFVMTVAVVDDSLAILILALFFTAELHLLSLVSLTAVALGLLVPGLVKLQKPLSILVAYFALPLFAFLSAGVNLSQLGNDFNLPLFTSIVLAIVIGKPVGILGTTFLVTKSKLGMLDSHISWKHLINVATVFALCFTVSMLMSEISLVDTPALFATANLAVITTTTAMLLISLLLLRIGEKINRDH
jgi:NhaA family Na+:H+ antiporter